MYSHDCRNNPPNHTGPHQTVVADIEPATFHLPQGFWQPAETVTVQDYSIQVNEVAERRWERLQPAQMTTPKYTCISFNS